MKKIIGIWGKFVSSPAYVLQLGSQGRFEDSASGIYSRRTCWGVLGLGVLTGFVLAWVWGAVWAIFADYGVLIRPAAFSVCFFLVFFARAGIDGFASSVSFSRKWIYNTVGLVLAVVFTISFVYLKPDWYRAEYALPGWIEWIRPAAKLYRVLFLMPIWGAWSMLISLQFAPPAKLTEAGLRVFLRKCGPVRSAVSLILPLTLTIIYFHYLGTGAQITIAAVTAVTAVLGTLVLSLLNGNVTRKTLLGGNLLTQLVFIATFLNFQ